MGVGLRDATGGPRLGRHDLARYSSYFTDIGDGIEAWLGQRQTEFRRTVRRRARRGEEQGFRVLTTEDGAEIMQRLPQLQTFYVRRQEERGGEGYRFDDDMVEAIGMAIALSPRGRFALSVLESDEQIIGTQLVQRAGTRMSCWITGFDNEWSRVGPGIAVLVEALHAGSRAGCAIADLGVGDQSYKDELQDDALRPRVTHVVSATTGSDAANDEPDGGPPPGDRVRAVRSRPAHEG